MKRYPVFLFLGIFLLTGCADFAKLRKQVAEIETKRTIKGEVVNHSPHQKSIVVLLYSEKNGAMQIVDYRLLKETATFAFFVRSGTYYLAAFEDLNNNLKYDRNEFARFYGKPVVLTISTEPSAQPAVKRPEERFFTININASDDMLAGLPTDIPISEKMGKGISLAMGTVTTFDNEIFSEKYAEMGYWQPVSFVKKVGFGIYFLEEFDEDKIPILFVHGAVATPKVWENMIKGIDRNKYQPWLFYYPTGIPLVKSSNALNLIIKNLHNKYQFKNLYVTAHSMGGLVTRSFIMYNFFKIARVILNFLFPSRHPGPDIGPRKWGSKGSGKNTQLV